MAISPLAEQEFVAHLFAPLEGPNAELAFRQITQVWQACRTELMMVNTIYGTGLPADLPADVPADLGDGTEEALAGLQDQAVDFQAIVRREHDVLNLSLVMATPLAPQQGRPGRMRLGAVTPPGWFEFARWWRTLTAGGLGALLGGATIFQAKSHDAARADVRDALPPQDDDAAEWWTRSATLDDFAVWEVTPGGDRAIRRLVVLGRPVEDARLSRFTWSAGDVALPPLGRYLMHAAKLRYESRVHGGSDVAQVRNRAVARLDRITSLLRDPPAGEALAGEAAGLAADEAEVAGTLQALRWMDRTVEIARANMASALTGQLPADARLATVVAERLADDVHYLEQVQARAEQTRALLPVLVPAGPARSVLRPPAPAAAPVRATGVQQRVGFGVDVVKYSDRTAPQQFELQRRLAGILERVLSGIGVPLHDTDRQDAGDGMMVVLPARAQPSDILPGLLHGWRAQVVADNAAHPEDRIRLRLSVASGPFTAAALGFTGATIIEAGRLLDSPPLRQAVADHSAADLVALVSDRLHTDVVSEGYPGLDADQFERVQVHVKAYAGQAWLWLGGHQPPGPVDRTPPRTAGSVTSPVDANPRRDVLVIHGDAEPARADLFTFLRAIGLHPLEQEHLVARTGDAAPRRDEVLRRALLDHTEAVVLIASPVGEPRTLSDEVLMAAGVALAMPPHGTVLVRLGEARLPGLLAGRDAVHINGGNSRGRHQLAERLRRLGFAVDTSGEDWMNPRLFQDY